MACGAGRCADSQTADHPLRMPRGEVLVGARVHQLSHHFCGHRRPWSFHCVSLPHRKLLMLTEYQSGTLSGGRGQGWDLCELLLSFTCMNTEMGTHLKLAQSLLITRHDVPNHVCTAASQV